MRKPARLTTAMIALSAAFAWHPANAQHEGLIGEVRKLEARETAIDAYIYGYSLVTMEMTRRVMTNVAAPSGTNAPMGQFARLR